MQHITPYSIEPRYNFKRLWILYFAKDVSKTIDKNVTGKYSTKLLDHTLKSATAELKAASEKETQTTAETTGDLTGNKTGNKITTRIHDRIYIL